MSEKEINPNFRRYNIIPDMRRLSTRSYSNLENALKRMNDEELKEYRQFLNDIDYEIMRMKKSIRSGKFFLKKF